MIYNKKIRIITLESCANCARLKERLKATDLVYSILPCEQYCEVCDELEGYTKTTKYPMIVVSDAESNITYVIYPSADFSSLGSQKRVSESLVTIPAFGEDNMIETLTKLTK